MQLSTDTTVLNPAELQETSGQDEIRLLRLMQTSRESDRREGICFRQGSGWFQLPSAGHESLAVVAELLRDDDWVYPHYRDRALMLARGVSNYEIALGYFGKEASSSAGRQMSAHFSAVDRKVMSCASPTGMQCLPAAGTAWACQLEALGQIVVCSIGEAATRQGEFYEALCLALERILPLVFLVEDNGYGISTKTEGRTPFDLDILPAASVIRVDGRDIASLQDACSRAFDFARSGLGPQVVWIELDRLMSHTSSDDHRLYRSPSELRTIEQRDPIRLLRDRLIREGALTEEDWRDEASAIECMVRDDYRRAAAAPDPTPESALWHVVSDMPLPAMPHGLPYAGNWTMVKAVNETLRSLLAQDNRVLLYGEDIEDPKGGVFGFTKGLSSTYPNRVLNSPLAEATIAGAACGLAVAGYKPIFELQFIDFAGPAFNQIVNQIATLRWRTMGRWKCPLVLYAPCGGYLPGGGPWHSQSGEGLFAHVPGLRVAIPSTPYDAAALMRAAVNGEDPVLLLFPKHLSRVAVPFEQERPISLGEAVVRRSGSDVTILAWGNCVEVGMEAAVDLAEQDIDVELIDLRSITPCDWETIRKSLRKTGRLVVVQEDVRTCSFGQTLIAELTSNSDSWSYLAAPPQLVSRSDVHVGFHPSLERAVLPSAKLVCEAARTTMKCR